MSARWPRVGRLVYGGAAIALGVIGLRWGDFATVWQPVRATVPHRTELAYVTAFALVLGGAATLRRTTARIGAVVLGLLGFGFALLWLPRVVGYPQLAGTWLGFLEEFSLVTAAIVVYATATPVTPARESSTARAITVARVLLGVCALSFGVAHFTALTETAAMVPRWLPPSQRFWAAVTGACHLAAGVALITGIRAPLAARLLTVMLLGFGALVWLPRLAADPGAHMRWAGNAVNLVIAGAVWVVADALAPAAARARGRAPAEAMTSASRPSRAGSSAIVDIRQ